MYKPDRDRGQTLKSFQAGLEKVDSHDHIVTPPLYGQVCHDLYKNKKKQ